MKEYSWEEYYEKFYDWAESTRKRNLLGLKNFGPAEEVLELLLEFCWDDPQSAAKLSGMALAAGVRFTPDQILELSGSLDKASLGRLAEASPVPFTEEELEDLEGEVEPETFARLTRAAKKPRRKEPEEEILAPAYVPEPRRPEPKSKGPGFLTVLAAFAALASPHTNHRKGRCTGDCAHCPPHYGYRYGRWYYGHGHNYGCEFGGNKGGGGRD